VRREGGLHLPALSRVPPLALPSDVIRRARTSFDGADESEHLIEVKTTGLGKHFPFYVTANEVRCSEDVQTRFHLFRVFDFARVPRAYILTGSLRSRCRLEPTLFRATI